MLSSDQTVPEPRVIDPLGTAVTDLLDLGIPALSDQQVLDAIRDLEHQERRLAAFKHQLLIAADEHNLPTKTGAGTLKKLLIETLRLSNAEACARVAAMRTLGTQHDLYGEDIEPLHPATAAAQADGDISADHARAIEKILKRIPGSRHNEHFEAAEQILADLARSATPEDITRTGEHLLAHLDPDGKFTEDKDRQNMRALRVGKQRADGMSPASGEFTPTLRALIDAAVAKFGRPGMNNPDDPESPSGSIEHIDRDLLEAAAQRDTRSAAQRTHDALLAMLSPDTDLANLGSHRGLPVSAILTMSVDDIEDAAGVATTATGGTVPMSEALKLAEHAIPWLAIFDHNGLPLHLGRARLANPAQRMALIAAMRGCTRPGCDAPASLCAVHHVREWSRNGPTDIENETLCCDRCHALVHDGPGGWKTVVLDKDSEYPGRTGWIAPAHIDPTGTPRVNHRHHPTELLAQALTHLGQRNEQRCEQRRQRLRQ